MRYFEDFSVGEIVLHRRGRTISQADNARFSLMTMNTAETHFNVESMKAYLGGQFDRPLVNAAIVIAVSVGLSSADMSGQLFLEVRLDEVRLERPVFPEDTLRAQSTVLALDDGPDERSGRLRYRIEVTNQKNEKVGSMVRTVLVKRRAHWGALDDKFQRALQESNP